MTAAKQDRISALLAKRAALDARIDRLKSRDAAAERKARSRALLLLGVTLEKQLKKSPDETGAIEELISEHLQPREQAAVRTYLQLSRAT